MSEQQAIPKGWVWVTVRDVAMSMRNGIYKEKQYYAENGTPCLRMYNIDDGSLVWENLKRMTLTPTEISEYGLLPGDLVVNRVNSRELVGKTCVIPEGMEESVYESKNIRLRVNKSVVDSKYLNFRLLHCGRLYFSNNAQQTVGMASVNQDQLGAFPIPLAPINEQRRIVAKIEELFSNLDAGVAALKRAKANLKRYRAAVLRAAVKGKLTEAWRAEHPYTEPASKLLERILTERRQKWEADQLAKFAANGKTPPKGWREMYVEPAGPDTTGLPELPEGWCWASVQQAGSVQLGRQRAPQFHSGPHMRPYLRVANVFEDRIDLSDVMEMNFTPQEFDTFRLSYGDILLNEGQSMELVGRPAMYRDEMPGACFTNSLVRFRVYRGVDTNYALKVFLAYLKNGRFQKLATITVNIAHLSAGRFSEIEFPLPPIEEQAAIVEEVDRHFSLIDAAEKAIVSSLARAARLRQSILKQAFEGKLVPQDPRDEPASVLLERLRANQGGRKGNLEKPFRRTKTRRIESSRPSGHDSTKPA